MLPKELASSLSLSLSLSLWFFFALVVFLSHLCHRVAKTSIAALRFDEARISCRVEFVNGHTLPLFSYVRFLQLGRWTFGTGE